jgi:hypothetical protein
MGVKLDPQTGRARDLWVSSDVQLYRMSDVLDPGGVGPKQADALFSPRTSYFTGDLDIHDLAVPEAWLAKLAWRERIETMASTLFATGEGSTSG